MSDSEARSTALAAFDDDGPLAAAIPGFRSREGQRELVAAVADAIEGRGCLIAEAGTGIGKTFAYLVPAMQSGKRIIVSTGTRQLQDQLWQHDVGRVQKALGLGLRTAVLKGRANYVCPLHLERNLADSIGTDPRLAQRLRLIEQFNAVDPVGDRSACTAVPEEDSAWTRATSTRDNCLGQDCPELRRCPLAKARALAQQAELLIVNHHLFCADMALREDTMGELLPSADVLIFDEAHQLPEIATEFFGEAVSTRQLVELAHDLTAIGLAQAAGTADWRLLGSRLETAARTIRRSLPEQATRLGVEEIAPSREPLLESIRAALEALESISDALEPCIEASTELAHLARRTDETGGRLAWWRMRFLRAIEQNGATDRSVLRDPSGTADHGGATVQIGATEQRASEPEEEAAVVWAQATSAHLTLKSTPLDAARRFGAQRESDGNTWIYLSATLATDGALSHFATQIAESQAEQRIIRSPFDYARRAALWVPERIGPPSGADFQERVLRETLPLLRHNRGRAFVLCTTLRAVEVVARRLRVLLDDVEVLSQGDAPRQQLLDRFRAGPASVLVGSAGFWEGVDVVGDRLSLVIIDKLPFPPPDDPVFRARSRAIEQAGGRSFTQLSMPIAAMALKQGAGRLIRSESDRGLLVVCDERLATKAYGRQLIAALPPFRRVRGIDAAIESLPG